MSSNCSNRTVRYLSGRRKHAHLPRLNQNRAFFHTCSYLVHSLLANSFLNPNLTSIEHTSSLNTVFVFPLLVLLKVNVCVFFQFVPKQNDANQINNSLVSIIGLFNVIALYTTRG